MQRKQFSRLMYLSWEIQRKRKNNRSRALLAAWAIYQNEDITVYHLAKKHSHEKNINRVQAESLTLFNR
jgi:hypothetical protein